MNDRLVTVRTCAMIVRADLAKSVLRAHGIESFLDGEYDALCWGGGRVGVQVRESHAGTAKEVLDQALGPEEVSHLWPAPEHIGLSGLPLWVRVILGVGMILFLPIVFLPMLLWAAFRRRVPSFTTKCRSEVSDSDSVRRDTQ